MPTKFIALTAAGALALGACTQTGTISENEAAGALFGGAAGIIASEVFDIDDGWRIATALAGAAAGALIARNIETNECAYSNGDGTYYTQPC